MPDLMGVALFIVIVALTTAFLAALGIMAASWFLALTKGWWNEASRPHRRRFRLAFLLSWPIFAALFGTAWLASSLGSG